MHLLDSDVALTSSQRRYNDADRNLQEERATLTRYDSEIAELEGVVKTKKEELTDSDLKLKQLEHDIQVLGKDRTAAVNAVANLEQQHEWISEESE